MNLKYWLDRSFIHFIFIISYSPSGSSSRKRLSAANNVPQLLAHGCFHIKSPLHSFINRVRESWVLALQALVHCESYCMAKLIFGFPNTAYNSLVLIFRRDFYKTMV